MLSPFSAPPIHRIHHHPIRAALAMATPSLFSPKTFRFFRPRASKTGGNDEEEMGELVEYMERLKNHEKVGVPIDAGTDSDFGFDLGRMRRLLRLLGDPHHHFKAVHIAGTKGKGSTAAFLSNILQAEGYSVGCYTSPHLLSIRERITLRYGEPVEATRLKNLFCQLRGIFDEAMELEEGALTHFEVFTALAFSLFSQEKVDLAVVEAGLGGARDATNVLTSIGLSAAVITTIGEEHLAALGGSLESIANAKAGIIKRGRPLVIGGPFQPHIEQILRQKASFMGSPVVSACDPGIHHLVKDFGRKDGKTYQSCDISVKSILKDLPLQSLELLDVKLLMLGEHQLRNAVTAACTSLCLRNCGWSISDKSIRAGLEETTLLGRGQFLECSEVESLGLSGVSVLMDGAHTEASAENVANIVKKTCPHKPVALVVAMASDKDHVAFCRKLLSELKPDIFLLTEVDIYGSKSRMTSASLLKDSCLRAASDSSVDAFDLGMVSHKKIIELEHLPDKRSTLIIGCETEPVVESLRAANRLLELRSENRDGLIVVTGSFHIVSSVLNAICR